MSKPFAIAAALIALAAPAAGHAAGMSAAAYEQARVSLPQILAQIARSTPGRHLNTTQGEVGGRPVFFVQWQTAEGRVVVFIVDAASGQIIGRQGG